MLINPDVFAGEMKKHWTGTLGNSPNPALEIAWMQSAQVFGEMIELSGNSSQVWKVLQPPTGSGKTQGLILYAAMLSSDLKEDEHPGVLIVTKRKEEADLIAQQINELASERKGWEFKPAISYHSDKKKDLRLYDLYQYPVLVICHKAYSMALDQLNLKEDDDNKSATWDGFLEFVNGERKLVVIDEAIDLIDYTGVSLENLTALTIYSKEVEGQFPNEHKLVVCLRDYLRTRQPNNAQQQEEIIESLPVGESIDPLSLDWAGFKQALSGLPWDSITFSDPKDSKDGRRVYQGCLEVVAGIASLLKTFMYFSKNNNQPTFNAARLLVPDAARGAVILDATASCNVLYRLFSNAQVITPPEGTRTYRNVSLKYSYGHRVGKRYMEKNADAVSGDLIAFLEERYKGTSEKRKVLCLTHNAVEPALLKSKPRNFQLDVGHWGAVDGSNEWKDYDVVVIFGLPYRPTYYAPCMFMALQGTQTTQWLSDGSLRRFKEIDDIRKAIDNSQMVTDVVQGINRIRCRKVINSEGDCPEAEVLILLGTEEQTGFLIDGIKKEMPGVRQQEFTYRGLKQKKRGPQAQLRSKYDDKLLFYFESELEVDASVEVDHVRQMFGISRSTMDRIVKKMQEANPDDDFAQRSADMGISYEVVRVGRANKACFFKTSA